jgi:hypothetical protein
MSCHRKRKHPEMAHQRFNKYNRVVTETEKMNDYQSVVLVVRIFLPKGRKPSVGLLQK